MNNVWAKCAITDEEDITANSLHHEVELRWTRRYGGIEGIFTLFDLLGMQQAWEPWRPSSRRLFAS